MNAKEKLLNVCSSVQTSLSACASAQHRKDCISSLCAIGQEIAQATEFLHTSQKRKFLDLRKKLSIVANVVEGVSTGLRSRDLNKAEMKKMLGRAIAIAQELAQAIDLEKSPEPSESDTVDSDTLVSDTSDTKSDLSMSTASDSQPQDTAIDAALEVIKKASNETGPIRDDTDHELADAIKKAKASRALLPQRLNEIYEVIRMPIVPIFTAPTLNNAPTYKKFGITAVSVEGYAIIFNQLLLMVSAKKAAAHDMSVKEFAQEALKALNDSIPSPYAFVSDTAQANPRNADIRMYWIMPDRKWSEMLRYAGSRSGGVKWGLPFSS
jgi:hypothetical protein